VGLENVNPREELKRLEEQIKAATQLAELKPIYFRLNEIISAHTGDFDVWVAGNDVKQLLVARGTLIQQGDIAPGAPAPIAEVPPAPLPEAPPSEAPEAPPPTAASQAPPLWESTAFLSAPPAPPPAPPVFQPSTPPVPPPPAPLPSPTLFDFTEPAVPPPGPTVPPRAPMGPPPAPTVVLPASTVPPPVPPKPAAPPPAAARRSPPPPPPKLGQRKRNPVFLLAPLFAILAILIGVFFFLHRSKARNAATAALAAPVAVNVATAPPGAVVTFTRGGRETTCTSDCKVSLAPGTYQVAAALDGYKAASSTLTVTAQRAAALNLTLEPQPPSVHFLTDLPTGTVEVDNQAPVNLQDGQLVLDNLAPGPHTVKVKGPNGDPSAAFSFDLADGRAPVIGPGASGPVPGGNAAPGTAAAGAVTARNMIAVLVASYGKQARLVTNAGPWKLALNGQPQPDAGPAGVDLTNFQPGVNEIVVGDGKDQRTLTDNFDAAPTVTAFLKTDINAGTLTVSTGIDGVRVFLNDKEYRRTTQRGQLRLQTLGKVTVRVAKNGFIDPPPQQVEVKKGAEVRLQFDLKPQPQVASLGVHGAPPGTEVLIDQKSIGTTGPDGSFIFSSVEPGDHTVELRREQFLPKRIQRTFVAGREVELGGAEVVLTSANGNIRLSRNPPSTTITYRRGDETEAREASGNQVELPAGTYVFTASAPGFVTATARLQVTAGENKEVDFTLTRERAAAPTPPAPKGMTEFADAQSWTRDGESWVHKGGGFVSYKLPPKGVFTFTVQLPKGGVFHSGTVRWYVQYIDSKNYLLTEMDRKNFWTGVIKNGEKLERVKTPHNLGNQKAFTVKLDIEPDRLVQSVLVGNQWKTLDTFSEPGRDYTQGHFGFLIPGSDEIAISDFKFLPK